MLTVMITAKKTAVVMKRFIQWDWVFHVIYVNNKIAHKKHTRTHTLTQPHYNIHYANSHAYSMHTAHTHPSFRSFGSSAILAAPYTIHSPKTNHQISSSKSSTKALIHRTTQYALYPCKRETTQRR